MTAEFFYFYLSAKYNYKYHNYGQRPVSSSYGRGSWGRGGAKLKKELKKRKKEKKRNGKNIGREREAERGNLTFK